MKRLSYYRSLYLALFCFLSISVICDIQAKSISKDRVNKLKRVELMIDVDFFDNMTVAQTHLKKDFYGPNEIADFFKNCQRNGVKTVYWRCMTQIANYRSKLNYNVGQVAKILSSPDIRHSTGAFAAKVGVSRKKCKLKELANLDFGGIVQKVIPSEESDFRLTGQLLAPAQGAFLLAIDVATGKIIARSKTIISSADFQKVTLNFQTNKPFWVGAMASGGSEIQVFIVDGLSLKSQKGKELLQNGDMEKHFMLRPTAWKQSGADFVTLNGDFRKVNTNSGKKTFEMLYRPYRQKLFCKSLEACDPLAEAVKQAHLNKVKIYAWFDPIDDGRVVFPPISAWSSKFMEAHPEYRLVDKNGNRRWGMLCFGYPEVRAQKTKVIKELLSYGVDGIALKISYQHNLVWDGNSYNYKEFLFNDVILQEYDRIWGKPENTNYDVYQLQMLYGNYFIQWLRELRPVIEKSGKRLCLFTRPGKYADRMCSSWIISPEKIIKEKLIDDLLLEARISGDNRGKIRRINDEFSYISLCRQYGIMVGYDYYLNGLTSRVKASNKHEYFRTQMSALIQEDIDFIGIYEGMYIERDNYWPDINYIHEKIKKMKPRLNYPIKIQEAPKVINDLALLDNGCKAFMISRNNKKLSVPEIIDGDYSNNSSVSFSNYPTNIEIKLFQARTINTVKIYAGNLSNVGNPSGVCAPKSYILKGLHDGKWIELVSIENASSEPKNGTLCFTHKFKPIRLNAIKLTVLKSGDTGCRLFSPKKPVIKPESRVTHIREISLFNKN